MLIFHNHVPVQTVKVTAILNVGRRMLKGLACKCLLCSVEWVNSYEGPTAG